MSIITITTTRLSNCGDSLRHRHQHGYRSNTDTRVLENKKKNVYIIYENKRGAEKKGFNYKCVVRVYSRWISRVFNRVYPRRPICRHWNDRNDNTHSARGSVRRRSSKSVCPDNNKYKSLLHTSGRPCQVVAVRGKPCVVRRSSDRHMTTGYLIAKLIFYECKPNIRLSRHYRVSLSSFCVQKKKINK